MGCCISKCRPKKSEFHEDQEDQHQQFSHNVQDKLMEISQTPKTTAQQIFPLVNPNKLFSPSKTPPSPSHSTSSSSASSFVSCATSKTSLSSFLSMSSSTSSAICTKDNSSFSNELLWSCYKENPHVIRINSLKETLKPPASTTTLLKQTCPQKRIRSNSPINNSASLARQKSFRKDQCPRDHYNLSSTLRSPSPSRRFGECHSRRLLSSSNSIGSYYNSGSFSRRENGRPSSPNNSNSNRPTRPCLRSYNNSSTREQRSVHRVGSKIDEVAVAQALASHEIDNLVVEDIDNPLISLDCFIFI